jgi:hypothetical protein
MSPPHGDMGGGGARAPVPAGLLYRSGGGGPVDPGYDHKSVFEWCLPDFYKIHCMGAQCVTVVVRVDVERREDDIDAVDLSGVFGSLVYGSGLDGGPDCQEVDFDCVGAHKCVVPAYSLELFMTYPNPAGAPAGSRPRLRFDCSVGVGNSTNAGQCAPFQRTILIGDVPGGGNESAAFRMPLHADGARLINTNIAVPTQELRQRLSATGAVVSTATIGKGSADGVPRARGRGARFFTIFNAAAGASTATAVIFDLSPN